MTTGADESADLGSIADRERRLAAREAELMEREERIRRAETRVEEAIAAQKEVMRARERETEEERSRRAELVAQRSREAAEIRDRERALAAREAELAARIEEIEDLVRGNASRDVLERRLGELRTALAAVLLAPEAEEAAGDDDRVGALDERARVLAHREQEFMKRLRSLTEREQALARRAADLDDRERALSERTETLTRRERDLDERERATAETAPREREPAAEPTRAPDGFTAQPAGEWNVLALERMVAERSESDPDRAMEWEAYLVSFRDFADAEGRLPATLDTVVWEVFGEEFAAARVRR